MKEFAIFAVVAFVALTGLVMMSVGPANSGALVSNSGGITDGSDYVPISSLPSFDPESCEDAWRVSQDSAYRCVTPPCPESNKVTRNYQSDSCIKNLA